MEHTLKSVSAAYEPVSDLGRCTMERLTEYHGWVAMAAQRPDWTEADWDEALRRVSDSIAQFAPEDGHSIAFAEEHANAIHTVLLTGYTDQDIKSVLELIKRIGQIAPDSYGELVVRQHLGTKCANPSKLL